MKNQEIKHQEKLLEKIISGGQTGADRGGLEAAKALGIPTGGTVPKGFMTENGPDESLRAFGLIESDSPHYEVRTEQNIKDSDGTLVFLFNDGPGTLLTIQLAKSHGKPLFVIRSSDLAPSLSFAPSLPEQIRNWIMQNRIHVLNVAGNRESISPGIKQYVQRILTEALQNPPDVPNRDS